jgi:hypothetical protein
MLHELDLYKGYYEGSNRNDARRALILSHDPATIKQLKKLLQMTQPRWSSISSRLTAGRTRFRGLVGKKRTPNERLRTLR